MPSIPAIYENGVFRPTQPVSLPEGTPVRVEPDTTSDVAARQRIIELLSQSYETGDPKAAERHNEHQP
jgi:predicted DNA-binding antitoxin AbrB/MazE fold protein